MFDDNPKKPINVTFMGKEYDLAAGLKKKSHTVNITTIQQSHHATKRFFTNGLVDKTSRVTSSKAHNEHTLSVCLRI